MEKIKKSRKKIYRIAGLIGIVLILAIVLEIFVFNDSFVLPKQRKEGITIIPNSTVLINDFFRDENGNMVSRVAGATLEIDNGGKYVNNLEIYFAETKNIFVDVKYIDPKDGREIILKKKLPKNLIKSELSFMNFLVFHLDSSPEKIVIQAQDQNIAIEEIKIDNNSYFNTYRFLFIFNSGLLVLFFVVFRKRFGAMPEVAFLLVALICGFTLSVSEPRSYVSWDEFIHYKNADKVALKNIVKKDVDDIYASTNSVPASYSAKEQKAIDQYFDSKIKAEKKSKKKKSEFSLVETYNRIAYLPSASVLFWGRLFNVPAHLIFVFGRLMNLLAYCLIVFFAIRKLKTGKILMAVIALLPTALFLAANYSYDPWVTAFTMLGLAYFFSEFQQPEKKIKVKDMVIMVGAFIVGLAPKAIYFLLMFLFFLLPKTKFATDKQYCRFILFNALAILIVLGSFILPFLIKGPGGGDVRGGDAVNSTEQVKFILSHPFEYVKVAINFVKSYINPLNSAGFIVSFAYLNEIPGFFFALVLLIIVMLTDKNEFNSQTSTWKIRVTVLGIFLATVMLIVTALYVSFNAVAAWNIQGVQPRYLLPLIFPLLCVFGSRKIKNIFNRNIYNMVIFAAMAFLLLRGIWIILTSNHF